MPRPRRPPARPPAPPRCPPGAPTPPPHMMGLLLLLLSPGAVVLVLRYKDAR